MIEPKPFTFQTEGSRAVLLLHGFTGNSADVRMIGRFLEKKGYTSHAPIFRGHGQAPEALLEVSPDDWWEDVQQAYQHLVDLGYDEIAIAGLSLGGVLGLKLTTIADVKAVIPMCTPMFFDNKKQLTAGFRLFAKEYKQLEGKNERVINKELEDLLENAPNTFNKVGQFINNVSKELDLIHSPAMIVQASQDEMINPDSAPYIYDHIHSDEKTIKWYENSNHAITFGPERNKLHEDIYTFLESLDWED